MKIKIEFEISLKDIVEDDYCCYQDNIVHFSARDIRDSVNCYYDNNIMDYANYETVSKVRDEYLRIAREKVGPIQLSLFDAETC